MNLRSTQFIKSLQVNCSPELGQVFCPAGALPGGLSGPAPGPGVAAVFVDSGTV